MCHGSSVSWASFLPALCRLRVCKNRPALFPGRMSYKVTKPGLICLSYRSIFFIVLLFIRAPIYVSLVFIAMCSVLVVLVKLSVLAKWLARKTPLRKPNRGEGIVTLHIAQAEDCAKFSWFIVLLHCFIVYLCCLLPLRDIFSYYYGTI